MRPSSPWITYRTRFLVKAKQLTANLSFTDDLGRHHSGAKGDYLVESSDGVLSIAPRRIFEDVYVALPSDAGNTSDLPTYNALRPAPARSRLSEIAIPLPLLARKSPQPCRDRPSTKEMRSL